MFRNQETSRILGPTEAVVPKISVPGGYMKGILVNKFYSV